MTLDCFFAVRRDGYSSHSPGLAPFDCHHGCFIAPLPTDIFADLDITDQYDVIRKASFDYVLSILALLRSSEIDWARYVFLEYLFFSCSFATGKVSSWRYCGWLSVSAPILNHWCPFLVVM